MNFQAYLKQVKQAIAEVSVDELAKQRPATLIDVREGDEYQEGYIPGATWIPRGKLELRIEDVVPERERDVVLYCAGGTRSSSARAGGARRPACTSRRRASAPWAWSTTTWSTSPTSSAR